MRGVPFVFDSQVEATIVEWASEGALEKDIARAIGITPQTFSDLKPQHPELQEAIDKGRALGRARLMEMRRSILLNIKDPARVQELQRLNRMLKTEEPDQLVVDEKAGSLGGFTIQVLPPKAVANT